MFARCFWGLSPCTDRLPPGISLQEGTPLLVSDSFVKIDTVSAAVATPDVAQPYKELGLKDDEYLSLIHI